MGGYHEVVGTLKPHHMLNNLIELIAPKDNGDGKTWMSLLALKHRGSRLRLHLVLVPTSHLECACFPEFLQNFNERHILWSLCLVLFHALTLKLPIQTSHSVAPKLPVSLHSGEKCQNIQ